MALIALCSGKGSPGVTVAGLAFTLSWTKPTILAECDPAGGDIAAGFLRELPVGERGLGQLAAAVRRGRLAEDFWSQLVDLAPGKTAMTRLVLPGIASTVQAASLDMVWDQLGKHFHSLEDGDQPFDVIADCGRLIAPHAPAPILAGADLVLVVLRPTLPSIRSAATALTALTGQRAGSGDLALVIVGEGTYSPKEIGRYLNAPVAALLPSDPATAAVLSTGGERYGGRLLRAAGRAEHTIAEGIAAARAAASTERRTESARAR